MRETNVIHHAVWTNHQLTHPCGIDGACTSSPDWTMVDCPDCLRTHPVPIVKAYCRPESRDEVYDCGVCGEFHTQAAWSEWMNRSYDGAPNETCSEGSGGVTERYTPAERTQLRDAGRRHWNA